MLIQDFICKILEEKVYEKRQILSCDACEGELFPDNYKNSLFVWECRVNILNPALFFVHGTFSKLWFL